MHAPDPVMLFVGVHTSGSSIHRLFPFWARVLGYPSAAIEGVDIPLDAEAVVYVDVVERIKRDDRIVGALVTSHKLSLFAATRHLFDEIDPVSQCLREVSCISKLGPNSLAAHAKDPESMHQELRRILQTGGRADPWLGGKAALLCLGAGGAGTALMSTGIVRGTNGPARVIVVDTDVARLKALEEVQGRMEQERHQHDQCNQSGNPSSLANGTPFRIEFLCLTTVSDVDALVCAMPSGSVLVNATGMGKDIPGSPISEVAKFPAGAVAWELNYRGERMFLQLARQWQRDHDAHLLVEDGWKLFIRGWCLVMSEVFKVKWDDALVEKFAEAASRVA